MRRPSGKKVPDIDEVEDIIPDEGEEPKSVGFGSITPRAVR